MKKFKKNICFLGILFIVAVFSFNSCLNKSKILNKTYSVTGTIYGMSTEAVSKYKSTEICPEYRIAIRPDNKDFFHDFDTKVSFSTYSKYKIGDKITIPEIYGFEVLNEPEVTTDEMPIYFIISTFCIILFLVCLVLFLTDFSEYSDDE